MCNGYANTLSLTFWAHMTCTVRRQHSNEHSPPAKPICYKLPGSQKSQIIAYGMPKKVPAVLGSRGPKEREEYALSHTE